MAWVLLRKSTVTGSVKLPRPKIVQTVIMRGSTAECRAKMEEIRHLPENQSTDVIDVVLEVAQDRGQKSHNSRELRKHNGKRNTRRVVGDAGGTDH